METESKWGTVAEAAEILGCTPRWIQRLLVERDAFKHESFGYQFRVWLPDVRRYRDTGGKSGNGKKQLTAEAERAQNVAHK